MDRVFSFLILVCVAAAIVGILRIAGVDVLPRSLSNRTEEAPSSAAPVPEKPARATAPRSRPAVEVPPASAEPSVPNVETQSSPSPLESPFINIRTDSLPVYSSNSADSSVLRLLEEGERVEPGIRVLSLEGWWVEVRLDQKTAGFMRTEDLARN